MLGSRPSPVAFHSTTSQGPDPACAAALRVRMPAPRSPSGSAVDRVLCNSYFSADMLTAAYGIDPVVCYLGVDSYMFRPSDERSVGSTAPLAGPLRVLSIGALHPVKGHDLAFAGDSPCRQRRFHSRRASRRLRARTSRLRVGARQDLPARSESSSTCHRGITRRRVSSISTAAVLVTVCAARLEPFGLTVLESTSCGTPVVAVAQGGYRETVIDGVNGYLAERNAASLGERIVRIVRGDLGLHASRPCTTWSAVTGAGRPRPRGSPTAAPRRFEAEGSAPDVLSSTASATILLADARHTAGGSSVKPTHAARAEQSSVAPCSTSGLSRLQTSTPLRSRNARPRSDSP